MVLPDPEPAGTPTGASAGPVVERLAEARRRVRAAAEAAGRDPAEVRILLATKTMPPEVIAQALAAGATLIGENRVQEVLAKADALAGFPHTMHFIGHLQSNKVNQLLPHIQCLQTLDSVDLIGRLQSRLESADRNLDVFIQVNVSGEQTKSGIAPADAREMVEAVAAAPRLRLRGFMTIGLNSPDRDAIRRGYRALATIRDRAADEQWPGAQDAVELSMGMSGDFADAIAEGATIVRLGSAVFGPRPAR